MKPTKAKEVLQMIKERPGLKAREYTTIHQGTCTPNTLQNMCNTMSRLKKKGLIKRYKGRYYTTFEAEKQPSTLSTASKLEANLIKAIEEIVQYKINKESKHLKKQRDRLQGEVERLQNKVE